MPNKRRRVRADTPVRQRQALSRTPGMDVDAEMLGEHARGLARIASWGATLQRRQQLNESRRIFSCFNRWRW